MLKWIEIDGKIISSNVRAIGTKLEKGVKFMAVVKANGYGHGAAEVSRLALAAGADLLGVMNASEGAELRKAGIKADIMLLAPSLKEEIGEIAAHKLIPTADSADFLAALNKKGRNLRFNLDVDTGLKRWGIKPSELGAWLDRIGKLGNLKFYSFSTHIAYTPYRNMTDAYEKLKSFGRLAEKVKAGYPGVLAHAANSLVLCDFPEFQFDMARIGNLIYGIYPADVYHKKTKGPPLKGIERPWKFFAKIISVKEVKRGETFGYANEIAAVKNMRVATIAAGYSDGLTLEPQENAYKISEGSKYWGVVNGKKAPFISKSAISNTLIDITGIPEAGVGSAVSLAIRRTAASSKIPRIYR
ncbi:MAG: alanine racemase [Elusimicrobia bacterium CG08_land_8_20_14_0_20_51_18]|nr:MAG: alanine racemase [Elusimicrobia bacterium CG08_land_8_20_14_0_20_51_18]